MIPPSERKANPQPSRYPRIVEMFLSFDAVVQRIRDQWEDLH